MSFWPVGWPDRCMYLWTLRRVVIIQGISVDRTASLRPEIALAESGHQHRRDDRVPRPPAVDVPLCHREATTPFAVLSPRSLQSHAL